MRISVALAVRNGEQYLPELLDSLARQTQPPHELVVYDDASEDSTPELLKAFATDAPFRVETVRGEGWRGHVAGFMRAAAACTGDAVAFCDGDDVWNERKLEICAGALDRRDTTLVMHTTRVVDSQLRDLGRTWPVIGESRSAPSLGLTGLDIDAPGMAMAFRRELLDVADFARRPPSRYGNGRQMLHDEWVFFVAGVLGAIQLLAEPLLLYRQHDANDSGGWVDRRRHLGLRPAIANYGHSAAHTAACADYLDQAARAATDAGVARRLAAGRDSYRDASRVWSLRLSLYDSRGRRERARVLRNLIAARAYRSRTTGGLGRAALGKDLAGVALRVTGDRR